MAELSPVLAAYFGGQKQQTDLITQAKEISDAQLRRQQATQELQQRQQTIDEIAKQHGVENKHAQDMFELELKKMGIEHEISNRSAAKDMVQQMRESNMAPPGLDIPANLGLNIPGLPGSPQPIAPPIASQVNTAPAGISNGMPQIPTYNTQQGATVQQPLANAAIKLPNGESVMMPSWQTAAASEEAKKASDTAQAVRLFNATKGPEYQAQLAFKDQQLQQNQQQFQNKIDELTRWHDMTGAFKDALNQAKVDAAEAKRFGYRTPEQYQQDIQNNVIGIATGQKSLSEITDAQEKRDTQEGLAAKHYSVPDKGSIADATNIALRAVRALKVNDMLAQIAGDNTQTGAKAANVVRDLPLLNKLSPSASQFNGLVQSEIAPLEKAQELSLARAGASVPFATMQKSITPYLTDDPKTMAIKTANAADIALTTAYSKVSNLNPEHRILIAHKIVADNPELLQNPYTAPAMSQWLKTGTYPSGGILKRLVK